MIKMEQRMQSLLTTALMATLILSLTSCGLAKDPGANLGLAVSPETANVVTGKGISCVAYATAKVDDSTPIADVEGDRVTFSRFALQWRSGDKLTITNVRATFYSAGIAGAETADGLVKDLDEQEIIALLGLEGLAINYSTPNPPKADYALTVDSTTGKASKYPPCGLALGGIPSSATMKTYTARVKIEVIGFGTTCDTRDSAKACTGGTEYPVRQSVTVRAQKY